MNPIEYIKENPRITTQLGAGLLGIISLICAVLGINPELAEPLTAIALIIFGGASQSRTEYQKNEKEYWKKQYEEVTEPDMTSFPDTPEEELTMSDFTME